MLFHADFKNIIMLMVVVCYPRLVSCVVSHSSDLFFFSVVGRPLTPEVFIVGTADGDVVAWDVRYCSPYLELLL